MTDNDTTEAVAQEDESNSAEDSALVKDLRKQIKELGRDLKSAPSRSEIEADIRAAVAREKAIESELTALKLPAGLSETVEGKLGDAEVTREKVIDALKAIGFEVTDSAEGGEDDQPEQRNAAVEELAGVANLGNQVANAATQRNTDNLTDKINAAETPEELATIMREAGQGT